MNRRSNDILGLDNVWPRPGWVVLDAARDTQFTGQIAFDSSPPVDVYFDRGRAYLAERRTDPPIGALLVDNGALDAAQLVRGTVRAGEHEHLGRLFELVPEVDRLLVLVTLELLTERLVAWVAGQSVRLALPTPYLMHPSGVHRWDSAEATAERLAAQPAPVADQVAAEAASVVPLVVPDLDRLGDDMLIQWSEPAGARRVDAEPVAPVATGVTLVAETVDVDAASEIPEPPLDLPLPDDPTIDRFEVVWPTGEVDRPAEEEIATGLEPAGDDDAESDVRVDVPDVADEVVLAVRQALAALEAEAVATRPSARQPAAPMFHYGGGGTSAVATEIRPVGAVAAVAPPPPPPPPPGSDPLLAPPPSSAGPAIPGLVGRPPTLPPAVHQPPPPPDRRRSALRRLVDNLRGR